MTDISEEELDVLASLASSMPMTSRNDFVRLVATKLAGYPEQARGPGLAHRVGVEAQASFLNVAIGYSGKYGRIR